MISFGMTEIFFLSFHVYNQERFLGIFPIYVLRQTGALQRTEMVQRLQRCWKLHHSPDIYKFT